MTDPFEDWIEFEGGPEADAKYGPNLEGIEVYLESMECWVPFDPPVFSKDYRYRRRVEQPQPKESVGNEAPVADVNADDAQGQKSRFSVLDQGHCYALPNYDGPGSQVLTFMKREGTGYPGNTGSHPGTNLQSVLRACLDRVLYLHGQIPHDNNLAIVCHLKHCLRELEQRAVERHGLNPNKVSLDLAAFGKMCEICGHVFCKHSPQPNLSSSTEGRATEDERNPQKPIALVAGSSPTAPSEGPSSTGHSENQASPAQSSSIPQPKGGDAKCPNATVDKPRASARSTTDSCQSQRGHDAATQGSIPESAALKDPADETPICLGNETPLPSTQATVETQNTFRDILVTARTALDAVAYTPVRNWNDDIATLKSIARQGLEQLDREANSVLESNEKQPVLPLSKEPVWTPISTPPTEADGWGTAKFVIVRPEFGEPFLTHWVNAHYYPHWTHFRTPEFLPSPPTPPDPFEEAWEKLGGGKDWSLIKKDEARKLWDSKTL